MCGGRPSGRFLSRKTPLRAADSSPISTRMKFLQLNFIPGSADVALLMVRIWFGVSLLSLHGWGKLVNFAERSGKFADPLGIGSTGSLALVVLAEVFCAGFIVLGLFTRLAALIAGIAMFTAFWVAHGGKLVGPGNGELAFLFLGACVALFLGGAGRFSFDARFGGKR
jgi:putative oxidoreductase